MDNSGYMACINMNYQELDYVQIPTLVGNSIVTTDSGSSLVSATLTNGQLLIGSTNNAPVAATLTAGTNISITMQLAA